MKTFCNLIISFYSRLHFCHGMNMHFFVVLMSLVFMRFLLHCARSHLDWNGLNLGSPPGAPPGGYHSSPQKSRLVILDVGKHFLVCL